MPKPRVPFSPEIVERLWLGLEAGHGLRRLCREPGMPTRATVMRWLKEKPDFAEDIALARLMGGLDGVGRSSGCKNG
ncbi:hypothetical protein, partial [Phenylobacterium sp.]|uniref:terminase small subunit-like protein n=1 Tax=Phenylobacterium sp. TaxID=1871053 RepID=UPI002EDB769E